MNTSMTGNDQTSSSPVRQVGAPSERARLPGGNHPWLRRAPFVPGFASLPLSSLVRTRLGRKGGIVLQMACALLFARAAQLAVTEMAARLRARPPHGRVSPPQEVAAGVFRLPVYGSNVYFVQSGSSWVLIDTAWAWGNCGRAIRQGAEALFGPNARPAAILLTHFHPDHSGAAQELARTWDCPVYVHPRELPMVAPDLAVVEQFANPLDRWLILPVLRALPRRQVESMLARENLKDVARAFDPDAAVPYLPDWTCIPTPGHSPGHIGLFRAHDRVLIAGDAVLTDDVSSLSGWLRLMLRLGRPHVFGPPRYINWDQSATAASVAVLAALEPRVVATSHGAPVAGEAVAHELRALAQRVAGAEPQVAY